MRINCYLSGNPVHDRAVSAFAEGCDGVLRSVTEYDPSDVAVVFGVRKKAVEISRYRGDIIDAQAAAGLKTVVLETGYIRRGDGENDYYAAGLGGLNGRADFRNHKMPPDRFAALGVELSPWHHGSYILLCGQVPWDASVDFTDHNAWLDEAVGRIRDFTNFPIVFRNHPKAPRRDVKGCRTSDKRLEEDLANAWAVVTFNSNIGVDAVLDGCPVFVDDIGSMVWSVANRNWSCLMAPKTPDRTEWANNISYAQWTLDEMMKGMAWNHLFR